VDGRTNAVADLIRQDYLRNDNIDGRKLISIIVVCCCFPGVTTHWVVSFTAQLRAFSLLVFEVS
jgi:hypothetical protein